MDAVRPLQNNGLACTLDMPAFVGTPEPRHRFQSEGLPRRKLWGESLASPRRLMPALAPPDEPLPAQAWGGGTRGAESDSPTWRLRRCRRCPDPSWC